MRAVAGRPATLYWDLSDDGGAPLIPDGGAVTVSVYTGLQPVAISAVAQGSPALVTTVPAHGLSVGQQIQIVGVLGSTEINGTWTVASVPTPTTFTIAVTVINPYVSGGGTVAQYVILNQSASLFAAGTGLYIWTLPAQAQLDTLLAVWSATVGGAAYSETVPVDIVASRLADPWLMRIQDSDVMAIAQASPLGKIALMILIDQIEEQVRDIIGYPPVLEGFRGEWDVLRGTLNDALYVSGTVNGLPYGWGAGKMPINNFGIKMAEPMPGAISPIYAGSINGTALDPVADIPNLRVQNGVLVWADYRPWISGRYSMWGTHGNATPSAELKAAARKLVHHFAQTVDFPDRAYSIVTEGAQIMFSMPSPDRPTGIPEIDAVLSRKALQKVI